MTPVWLAVISATYVAALFVIAWFGDRETARGALWLKHPIAAGTLFSLTLAVYNTSWSFYGSVGRAARTGYGFLPIYVAPVLLLTFGRPVVRRLIEAAEDQSATSVSDFLATRFGARQSIAALVTIGSLPAVLPYISLQLRAVASSFELLSQSNEASAPRPLLNDTGLWLALSMAVLIVTFGVRQVQRSERHRGLMIAVAFDSVVKLAAFLVVAVVILADFARRGPGGLASILMSLPSTPRGSAGLWLSNTIVAALSFLCLPHMFHVFGVEQKRPSDVRWGARLFPVYLGLLSLLMLPVAKVGLITLGGAARADSFMIDLPLASGRAWLAVVSYVGGLSAATGMVIVATVALATMLCNDVIMPLALRRRRNETLPGHDISSLLLNVRRVAVVAILVLAFAMNRVVSQYDLTQTGLVSFVGVAQFGPALLAGLYWPRASGGGAVAGIASGLAIWAWLLISPSGLQPALSGDPIVMASAASLVVNTALLVLVSVAAPAALSATAALRVRQLGEHELRTLAVQFLGADAANAAFDAAPPGAALTELTRTLLAGAIGTSSARVVITAAAMDGRFNDGEARNILDEASAALRQNHELLRTVLDTMPQGICIFDSQRCVAAWNRPFLRLLDIPAGVVRVGLPLAHLLEFNLSRAEYNGSDPRRLLSADVLDKGHWPYAYERERPDGARIEVAFDRLPDGGLISTYSDVTDRHQGAAALRTANDRLEARVRERTEELQRAKAAAEAANLAKTRFLAAASHDLLQPIHAARLFIATVEVEPALPISVINAAAHAGIAIQSTEAMIHGMTDLSAIESGRVLPRISLFSVDELLEGVAREAAVVGREAGVGVGYRASGVYLRSDSGLLRRIVQNYLSNALRHSGAEHVLLRCRPKNGIAEIQVWDDGCGVPTESRRGVFDEFSRGVNSSGMGLGLAIVRRMGEMLGHETGVRSYVGRGSCFFVRADIAVAGVRNSGLLVSRSPQSARLRRVLVVDDNVQVQAAAAGLLRQWGFEVETTPGVTPPDVVVADYHLGEGLTGLDLHDRLTALWNRQVPLILVTADRSSGVLALAETRGLLVLHKPVDPQALQAALADVP